MSQTEKVMRLWGKFVLLNMQKTKMFRTKKNNNNTRPRAHAALPLPQLTLKVCFCLPGRITERKKRMFFFLLGKQSVLICREMLLITPSIHSFPSLVPISRAHHPLTLPDT